MGMRPSRPEHKTLPPGFRRVERTRGPVSVATRSHRYRRPVRSRNRRHRLGRGRAGTVINCRACSRRHAPCQARRPSNWPCTPRRGPCGTGQRSPCRDVPDTRRKQVRAFAGKRRPLCPPGSISAGGKLVSVSCLLRRCKRGVTMYVDFSDVDLGLVVSLATLREVLKGMNVDGRRFWISSDPHDAAEDGAMRESMEIYPRTAAERAMKLQEVLLRATSGKIKWWQAAQLIGISERQMRRWRKRYEEQGYQGLLDRRRRKPSSRRVAKEQAEEVLSLYRDRYFDLNVRHFHEKLGEQHQIGLSYTWVKQALQAAGLVKRKARRGVHRKRR